MKIVINNYKCPSLNLFYAGKHWTARKKLADEVHELVYFEVLRETNDTKRFETFDKCNIFFDVYYKGFRRHDPDNCCIKLFIDGLVKAGVMKDDNSKIVKEIAIRCHTGQAVDKITISISDYDE